MKKGINTIEKRKVVRTASLLLSEKNYSDTVNNPQVNKNHRVRIGEIENFVSSVC